MPIGKSLAAIFSPASSGHLISHPRRPRRGLTYGMSGGLFSCTPRILFSLMTFSFCSPSFPPLGGPLSLCRVLILLVIGSLLAAAKSFTGGQEAQPFSTLGEVER